MTNFRSGPTKTQNSWSGQLESGLLSNQARPAQTNKNNKINKNQRKTDKSQIWANKNTKILVWPAGIETPQLPGQASSNQQKQENRQKTKIPTNFRSGPTKTTNSWSGQLESGLRSSQARPDQPNINNKSNKKQRRKNGKFQTWANKITKFLVCPAGIETPQPPG